MRKLTLYLILALFSVGCYAQQEVQAKNIQLKYSLKKWNTDVLIGPDTGQLYKYQFVRFPVGDYDAVNLKYLTNSMDTLATDLAGIRDTLVFHSDSIRAIYDSLALHRDSIIKHTGWFFTLRDSVSNSMDSIVNHTVRYYDILDSLALHRDTLTDHTDRIVALEGASGPVIPGTTGQILYNSADTIAATSKMTYYDTYPQLEVHGLSANGILIKDDSNTWGLGLTSADREIIQFGNKLEIQGTGKADDQITIYNNGAGSIALDSVDIMANNRFKTTGLYNKLVSVTDSVLVPLRAYNATTYQNSKRAVSEDAFRDKIETLSGATPGGDSLDFQFSNGTSFGGATGFKWTGTHVKHNDGVRLYLGTDDDSYIGHTGTTLNINGGSTDILLGNNTSTSRYARYYAATGLSQFKHAGTSILETSAAGFNALSGYPYQYNGAPYALPYTTAGSTFAAWEADDTTPPTRKSTAMYVLANGGGTGSMVYPGAGIALSSGSTWSTSITTSAGLASAISNETGSGALVFGTSPTFTTNLTTPTLKITTGATDGYYWKCNNADGSGAWSAIAGGSMVYPGAGIAVSNGSAWSTSITASAGLAGALSDETGSGAAVFATSPTFAGTVTVAASTGIAFGGNQEIFSNAADNLYFQSNTHTFKSSSGGTDYGTWDSGGIDIATGDTYDINGASIIDNTAYGSGWDGVTTIAPSKDAVYDKIQAIAGGTMTYPGAGIGVSTGSAWSTSITASSGLASNLSDETGSGLAVFNSSPTLTGSIEVTGDIFLNATKKLYFGTSGTTRGYITLDSASSPYPIRWATTNSSYDFFSMDNTTGTVSTYVNTSSGYATMKTNYTTVDIYGDLTVSASEMAGGTTGYVNAIGGFKDNGTAGIDVTFTDNTDYTITVSGGIITARTPPPSPMPKPTVPQQYNDQKQGVNDQIVTLEYSPDLKRFRAITIVYENGIVVNINKGNWKRKTIFN